MPSQDIERYRQKAAECEDEAAKATSASAKEAWLQAAEGMEETRTSGRGKASRC